MITPTKSTVMKIISSLMCSSGEAEQDTAHILQTCKTRQALRRDMTITNNTTGEALWTRGYPTEDNQIHSGKCKGERKEEEEHQPIYHK